MNPKVKLWVEFMGCVAIVLIAAVSSPDRVDSVATAVSTAFWFVVEVWAVLQAFSRWRRL